MQEYLQITKSKFHLYREKYQPKLPKILKASSI